KDLDYLTRMAQNDGYAYAEITPRTQTLEDEQKVDVTYNIKKGSLVYFNRINIMGNTKTRDKVIRRQLEFTEGDLYSSDRIKNSYARLNKTRYFEEVNFQTAKGPDESLTDINISVKERPTGMFSVGAGYSGQDGPMIMAQIAQQNLFGRGQTLSLQTSLGTERNTIALSFTEPALFDRPLWMKADLWKTYQEYDTYNLDSKGLALMVGFPLWELIGMSVGYRLAMNNVMDVQDIAAQTIKDQAGESTQSGILTALSRDTTDDAIFPTSGARHRIGGDFYGGPFGGDVSFGKYNGSTSLFFRVPPFGEDLVFSPRARIGYIQSFEGKEVPVWERYILGGINSIRGLKDVGPRDPVTNDIIGGTTMLLFNFELVFPLIKNAGMKGVVFFDTGNAWNYEYDLGDMRNTTGAGIRWYSPIGPLRLEWGYVLDRKEGEPAYRWDFTIGWFM
ncbi:MAG: outer membrane protein assembly factor BamA, partial [Syntrophales bacterium]